MTHEQNRARTDNPSSESDSQVFYAGDKSTFSVFAFANVLLRHPRLVILMPLAAFVAAFGLELAKSRVEFASQSAFMPQAGITAQAGFNPQAWLGMAQQNSGNSPDFYRSLLKSRDLLRRAGLEPYRIALVPGSRDTVLRTLPQLYNGQTAAEVLPSRVSMEVDAGAGIVTLRTIGRYPELALAINQRMLDLMNDFNVRRAQVRAAAEARFIQSRMDEARIQLDQAELDLQRFLEQNRNFESSPQLSFARTRLQRRVELRQELYLSLARSYESARIEQMRNIPAIMILEPPQLAGTASTGRPLYAGFVALVATLIVAVGIAYLLEFLARQPSQNPDEFEEFRELSRSTLTRLAPKRTGRARASAGARNNGE